MRGFTLLAVGFGLAACGPLGEGCTIAHHDDGTSALICPDGTSAVIANGRDGAEGPPGPAASACSVQDDGAGTKTITCEDGTSVVLHDGLDGQDQSAVPYIFDGDFEITSVADMLAFSVVTEVTGDLTIAANTLAWLDLPQLSRVGGSFEITDQDALTRLHLPALASVEGHVFVLRNAVLPNLDGLSALSTVGSHLSIGFNPQLVHVDGLGSLTHIGKFLGIEDNASLASLSGLRALTSIAGDLVGLSLSVRNSPALTSLDGLEHLGAPTGAVVFQDNAGLCESDVAAFLAGLRAQGWSGSSVASGNDGGCTP